MALAATGLATHIFNNHLKSVFLLAGFPVLLLMMLGAFFAALDALAQGSMAQPGRGINWDQALESGISGLAHYGHWAFLAAGTWFVIAFFFHSQMMRAASGAQPVTRAQMPRIYNLLENLCISRGLTMPQFEVIDSPALNAFATGIGEKSYRIVLTRGLIEKLQDDELEAVIAHELSHIMNRDVRLLIISVIFVGIISFLAEFVFRMLVHGGRVNHYARSRNRREGGGHVVILLVALAILVIGYIFAIAIRFSLSRKREYLADAGAVDLTHNPEAMMRALLRISGHDAVPGMPDEVQQMCIENSHNFMGLFATHPKIEDRVRVISELTQTPVPDLQVSLRRVPKRPWG